MAELDVVNVPGGTEIIITTQEPDDKVVTYSGLLRKVLADGTEIEVRTYLPDELQGDGARFTMDLENEDDQYIFHLTAVGSDVSKIDVKIRYAPPPPPEKSYEAPVKNGETDSTWAFFRI